MKTTDLFKINRTATKLNESLAKTFGKKLNLESFDLSQLEDARNKLRTQVHQVRSEAEFNENLENETLTQAQWMLDTINAEIAERQELIADAHTAESEYESAGDAPVAGMSRAELLDYLNTTEEQAAGMSDDELRDAANEKSQDYAQDNMGEGSEFRSLEEEVIKLLKRYDENANEIGAYGDPDIKKIVALLQQGNYEDAAEEVWYSYTDQDGGEVPQIEPYLDDLMAEFEELVKGDDADLDEAHDVAKTVKNLAASVMNDFGIKSVHDLDAQDIEYIGTEAQASYETVCKILGCELPAELGPVEYNDESIGDDHVNRDEKLKRMGAKPLSTLDKLKMMPRQMKAMARGDSEDDLVNYNKMKAKRNESIQGDNMSTLREGEIQQAQSIVTAKTMVDRVGRWIEELSGMENDTLLQLGDQIRDEQGQEAAKGFISSVAPAIQQALENLKATRESLASGVRTLTGEEQSAAMLGAEPEAEMGADEFGGAAEPDAMNAEVPTDDEVPADDFAAAEPAAGGVGDAGRAKRESIDRSNSLLKVLAG
jgi:hypothetical protein